MNKKMNPQDMETLKELMGKINKIINNPEENIINNEEEITGALIEGNEESVKLFGQDMEEDLVEEEVVEEEKPMEEEVVEEDLMEEEEKKLCGQKPKKQNAEEEMIKSFTKKLIFQMKSFK